MGRAFQFPPLREGRPERGTVRRANSHISIPAPARGATREDSRIVQRDHDFNSRPCARGDDAVNVFKRHRVHFNSRPCARGDPAVNAVYLYELLFQFPPLREGRPGRWSIRSWARSYFNSRPCARGDQAAFKLRPNRWIFQFPPLREGRLGGDVRDTALLLISIPAPARGATRR